MVAVDERHRDFFYGSRTSIAICQRLSSNAFCQLIFRLSPSIFLLNVTLHPHVKKYEDVDREFVKEFLNSKYVDDLSSSSSSVEEAFQLFLKSKAKMQEAGS